MSSGKKGRGRQKVEMKQMSNECHRRVTFSKRRNGLFNKASELSTLCGAEVALVVFSPGEKAFSFGHPNVDTVIDRYLSGVPPQNNDMMQLIEAERNAKVRELNTQLTQTNTRLDGEKKLGDELSENCKVAKTQFWWACPIDEMNNDELESFKKASEHLKKILANMCMAQGPLTQTNPFNIGNASASNISLHHQPPPQQAQTFPPEMFHGFNNMGGGYGPPGFF